MQHSNLFVNLPVKDLPRARAFFEKLGYSFNPQFSDEKAACLVLGNNLYAMLLTEPFFKSFTPREIPDPKRTTGVLLAVDHPSRASVDAIAEAALAAGGSEHRAKQDLGFMYSRAVEDLDGHVWEHVWMQAPQGA